MSHDSFILNSDKLRVTDPCYDRDTWCSGVLNNCLPGIWKVRIITSDEKDWGIRNAELIIWHEDFDSNYICYDSRINVGVDSGQAGFFDDSLYPESIGEYRDLNSFYRKICEGTHGNNIANIGFGVACGSGFGDGGV